MYYGPGYDRDYFNGYPDYSGRGSGIVGAASGGGRKGAGGLGTWEYQGGYRGGRGDQFGGYGRMNGPGRGLLAHTAAQESNLMKRNKWMEARPAGYKGINGNSLMR